MTEKLKDFIARHVFHPLQGMTLGDWWALLRRHRFAIDLRHSPRALVQTAISASNSVNARIERWRFGRQIEAARVEAPLFILGHYRSGTTHLHNLLALDPQFAAPNLFQVLNPHTFLTTERWAAPVANSLIVRRRYQDEMAQGVGMPSEDEFATCTMTGLSPYMGWCFPGDGADYDRYLTFRNAQESEVGRWKHALTTFLKKLTVRFGPPAGPQVAPAYRPHPAAPGAVPRRPVRSHPPGPLRRLPLDEAHDPCGAAPIPVARWTGAGRRRSDHFGLRRDVRRLLRGAGPDPRGSALRGRLTRTWSEIRPA